jgi:uncharacterized protein YdeI (YjbR/CyaY-like superfamily)
MKPRFFRTAADFRTWLEKNHARVDELTLGFYNQKSARKGISYKEAVDEALCFGWIDGVRRSLDEERYTGRFTPRRPRSIWSRVNIKRVAELEAAGRMAAPGREAFARLDPRRTGVYSFEAQRERAQLGPDLEARFRANARAWAFFQSRPPWYQRTSIWWIASAKKEETRLRRLAVLIECSAKGEPIPGLDRRPGKRDSK